MYSWLTCSMLSLSSLVPVHTCKWQRTYSTKKQACKFWKKLHYHSPCMNFDSQIYSIKLSDGKRRQSNFDKLWNCGWKKMIFEHFSDPINYFCSSQLNLSGKIFLSKNLLSSFSQKRLIWQSQIQEYKLVIGSDTNQTQMFNWYYLYLVYNPGWFLLVSELILVD